MNSNEIEPKKHDMEFVKAKIEKGGYINRRVTIFILFHSSPYFAKVFE
ncbi:MAG: hypothetical protein AB7V56_15145 [Candidatus Nitrosocosmicus sp.]